MRQKFFLSVFFVCIVLLKITAQSTYIAGGRAQAMGGNSLLLDDVWNATNSPASLGNVAELRAGIWTERRFNLKELSNGAVAVSLPVFKNSGLGISVYQFGASTYYLQQNFTLSYGMKLSKHFSAGVGLHTLVTSIQTYGNSVKAVGEIGVNYYPTPTFSAGLNIWNLSATQINTYESEKIPTIIRAAAMKRITKNLLVGAEAQQQLDKPVSFRFGVEYNPYKNVELQIGLRTSPLVYSFGLGVLYQRVKLHLGIGIFEVLGPTPDISFEYINANKK